MYLGKHTPFRASKSRKEVIRVEKLQSACKEDERKSQVGLSAAKLSTCGMVARPQYPPPQFRHDDNDTLSQRPTQWPPS